MPSAALNSCRCLSVAHLSPTLACLRWSWCVGCWHAGVFSDTHFVAGLDSQLRPGWASLHDALTCYTCRARCCNKGLSVLLPYPCTVGLPHWSQTGHGAVRTMGGSSVVKHPHHKSLCPGNRGSVIPRVGSSSQMQPLLRHCNVYSARSQVHRHIRSALVQLLCFKSTRRQCSGPFILRMSSPSLLLQKTMMKEASTSFNDRCTKAP